MKKILIFIMMVALLPMLSSCSVDFDEISADIKNGTLFLSKEEKLEKALERMFDTSYTMEGAMRTDITLEAYGQTEKQTMVTDMMIECDVDETYSESITNGQTQYEYAKINGDYVDVYTMVTGYWVHETETLERYEEGNDSFFMDVDFYNVFEYKDGVFIGDTKILTECLEEYSSQISSSLGNGMKLDKFEVQKYDIIMEKGEVSEMDIVIVLEMSYYNQKVELIMSMPMTVSKVGETEVTIPEGINLK